METNWKTLAIRLYMARYGRRCVVCSKPVTPEEATLTEENGEIYLFHQRCKDNEGSDRNT
jgi:hypothetical protein